MRANQRHIRFAICLTAKPGDDLEVGKVYRVLPDAQTSELGCKQSQINSTVLLGSLVSLERSLLVRLPPSRLRKNIVD